VDPINNCQLKNGQIKDKRMISIVDESGISVQACFWAEQAHAFDELPDHPVIACKNIRVTEYGGKSLNQHEDTYLELRPKHPRALELREWYDKIPDKSTAFKPLSEG
jgi:replication factor A1